MERRLIYLLQVPTWVYKLKVGLQHYDRLVDKARILVSHYRSKAGAGVLTFSPPGRTFFKLFDLFSLITQNLNY